MNSNIGVSRIYNSVYSKEFGLDYIVKWDVLTLCKHQKMIIHFISSKSNNLQGIRIAIDNGSGLLQCELEKKKEYWLWENQYMGKRLVFSVTEDSKISIYNMFYLPAINSAHMGGKRSLTPYSGMIVIDKGNNIFEYHCNDGKRSTEFDNLVFELRIVDV